MHSGLRQSGLQGQLYLTVVLENNKWCIHQLQRQGLFSGCRVCTRNDEQPSLLLFPSSERTTEFSQRDRRSLQLWQNGEQEGLDKEVPSATYPFPTRAGPNDNRANTSTQIILQGPCGGNGPGETRVYILPLPSVKKTVSQHPEIHSLRPKDSTPTALLPVTLPLHGLNKRNIWYQLLSIPDNSVRLPTS